MRSARFSVRYSVLRRARDGFPFHRVREEADHHLFPRLIAPADGRLSDRDCAGSRSSCRSARVTWIFDPLGSVSGLASQ